MQIKQNQHSQVYRTSQSLDDKIERYFIPFSQHIEKSVLVTIILLFVCSVVVQIFILSHDRHQALVNKAIRYEGVFLEDPIEAKATLQPYK